MTQGAPCPREGAGAVADVAVEQNQDYKLFPPTYLSKHRAQHSFGFLGVFLFCFVFPNSIHSWSKSRDGNGGDESIPKMPAAVGSPAGGSRNLRPQAKGWSRPLPLQEARVGAFVLIPGDRANSKHTLHPSIVFKLLLIKHLSTAEQAAAHFPQPGRVVCRHRLGREADYASKINTFKKTPKLILLLITKHGI